MQTWKFPSSSGPGEYTTRLHDDGLLDCDCRGFLIKRPNKPRQCRHITDEVVKKSGLHTVQKGDYLYAVLDGAEQPTLLEQQPVDFAQKFNDAEANGYVNPMLASALTKGEECKTVADILAKTKAYQTDDWLAEEKYNGQRVILSVTDNGIFAWSRPRAGKGSIGLPKNLPPHLIAQANALPRGTYDAEVLVPKGKHYDVTNLENRDKQCLFFFDLLRTKAGPCMDLPYFERRQLLEMAVNGVGQPSLLIGPVWKVDEASIQAIWDRGGEGVILKRKTSIYRPGWRSPDWVKVKLIMPAAMTVTGYAKGKNGPYSSLVLRADDGSETKVKTKNNDMLRQFEADPQWAIGRRVVISHQGRSPDGGWMHPMFDHWAGPGE